MARIEGLTHLGLGKLDDGRTLLPRVLPDEEVAVAQDGTLRIITPSPQRVAAPCRHFKSCGGCAMQHASDAFVAEWKQGIVRRALTAQGLAPTFRAMHTSPAQSRRRAKFSGRRTKKGVLIGFHARGSDTIVPVPDCLLVTPSIRAVFPALEALIPLACSRKGEIALTVTDTANGPDVLIETDKGLTGTLRIELASFAQAHRLARLAWGNEVIVTMLPPVQAMGRATVEPPAGAFLQATREGEAALLAAVSEITQGAARIVDLFSGVGTFALPLAQRCEIHAVEGEAEMIASLDRAWRGTQGLKRITTETRDLFRRPLQPDEFEKYDAVVIDPPRAGAEAQIATLADSGVAAIAMVSCNPVSFARDARTLIAVGYIMNWVQVIDQFRWSPHVEVVASFTHA